MRCKHNKFDLPSESLRICPEILNLAHSPAVTSEQVVKFIKRNESVVTK